MPDTFAALKLAKLSHPAVHLVFVYRGSSRAHVEPRRYEHGQGRSFSASLVILLQECLVRDVDSLPPEFIKFENRVPVRRIDGFCVGHHDSNGRMPQ